MGLENLYDTRAEGRREIFEYIEFFYNRSRLHFTLGFKTPEEYESLRKWPKLLSNFPGEDHTGKKHTEAMCALRSHKVYGKYVQQLKNGRLRIDRMNIRKEEYYDGEYLIQTSDDTLAAEVLAKGNKPLIDIEDVFRTMKIGLKLRPAYHRLEKGSGLMF